MLMRRSMAVVALAVVSFAGNMARAQHDAHRNAVQAIADGRLQRVDSLLSKAGKYDPETHFVRMLAQLKQGQVEAAVKSSEAALQAGLPFERLVAGPRELLAALHQTESFGRRLADRPDLRLVHGPMIGSVTDSAASFWVRTAKAAEVRVVIGDRQSQPVKTGAESDYTATVQVDGLSPASEYAYQLQIDGQGVDVGEPQFRTYPRPGSAAKFSVVFGGGAGYVPKWERMWDTILETRPDALLMLGDNVYIDQPEHTLCQHYCYYRRQSRPEWRRLVASTPTYAIYDDHDFGTNDCVPGPKIESPPWKRQVWNLFRQNWVNPAYGGGEQQPGCWFDFHIGDVHFILIDGRYYRDRTGGDMLGPAQEKWLLETLNSSTSTFKVLASPVPWTEGVKPGSRDPWDGYPQQRERIFSFIEQNEIPGVLLIAADRHRTDLRTTRRPDGYDLYEFESSRLTNRHTHGVVKTPGLIWGYNKTCSFARMRFDTTASDPRVTLECISIDGETIHSHVLRASQLK